MGQNLGGTDRQADKQTDRHTDKLPDQGIKAPSQSLKNFVTKMFSFHRESEFL